MAEPEAWPPLSLEAWHTRQTGPSFSSTRLVGTDFHTQFSFITQAGFTRKELERILGSWQPLTCSGCVMYQWLQQHRKLCGWGLGQTRRPWHGWHCQPTVVGRVVMGAWEGLARAPKPSWQPKFVVKPRLLQSLLVWLLSKKAQRRDSRMIGPAGSLNGPFGIAGSCFEMPCTVQ